MKKKNNGLLNEYSLGWKYIVDSKNYIFIITGLFLLFLFIGFVAPNFFVDEIIELISRLNDETEGMNFFQLFIFIFNNNLKTSFISMVLGIAFGVFVVMNTIINSYVIGFVGRAASNVKGPLILWRLFPHGIFELPAFILSLGVGLRLGMFLFFRKQKKETFLQNVEGALRVFVLYVLPLLIVAAFIETFLIKVLFPNG